MVLNAFNYRAKLTGLQQVYGRIQAGPGLFDNP
jgi:hypothetical protein